MPINLLQQPADSTPGNEGLDRLLYDCSIDANIAFDSDRNIIAWNIAAELIFKQHHSDVIGKPILQVLPSMANDPETLQAIRIAETGMKTFVGASKFYDHRRQVENHFIPLKNRDGQIKGIMNLVHDVAHRIKAEEDLQSLNEELQRRLRQLQITSDELAYLTYITGNKIKEPIRQVYTAIEHLIKIEARNLSNAGKASFRRMQSSVNKMDMLLDDMMKLSQVSILEKPDKDVDLAALAREVGDSITERSDKKVSIVIGSSYVIKGHENYLRLLLSNLIDNAVKFNENKQVIIQIDVEKININLVKYSRLTITDNGIGFNKEESARIFLMFERLHPGKYKGSGIGLTLSKKIMEVHDGFIDVESTPSEGSSFRCYFRMQPEGLETI